MVEIGNPFCGYDYSKPESIPRKRQFETTIEVESKLLCLTIIDNDSMYRCGCSGTVIIFLDVQGDCNIAIVKSYLRVTNNEVACGVFPRLSPVIFWNLPEDSTLVPTTYHELKGYLEKKKIPSLELQSFEEEEVKRVFLEIAKIQLCYERRSEMSRHDISYSR